MTAKINLAFSLHKSILHAVDPRQKRNPVDADPRLKRAEESVGARALDLQLIVEGIPAHVAVISPTGEVVTLNQPCLDYFGKALEELKGWASSNPVHPEDLPHVTQVLTHALKTGETYEVESHHRRFDGVYRWFHVRGLPLTDSDGSILRWCVLLTDIDDLKKAEEALQANERNLSLIINTFPSGARASRTRLERPGGDGA